MSKSLGAVILCLTLGMPWSATRVLGDDGAAAPPGAADALERAMRQVVANRGAALTVVLKGRVWSVRSLLKPVADPSKSNIFPNSPPHALSGTFAFFAANGGRKRRWDKTYDVKGIGVDERRAVDGEVVYDALDPDRGYIRTAAEFLAARADNVDFYRDHWFDEDVQTLDASLDFLKHHDVITSRKTPDGGTQFVLGRPPPGLPAAGPQILWALNPPALGGLVRYQSSSNRQADVTRWSWGRDPRSKIWYPALIKRWYLMRYPDGSESSETIVLLVREAKFNEPIPDETFTFAGMGLKPTARIVDMRRGAEP